MQPEEIEEQQAKYEMVFKNIEELDKQGVQILSPREIELLRKRFKDVHTKFTQYQKPTGESKWDLLILLVLEKEKLMNSSVAGSEVIQLTDRRSRRFSDT